MYSYYLIDKYVRSIRISIHNVKCYYWQKGVLYNISKCVAYFIA